MGYESPESRKKRLARKYDEIEAMPKIPCACGCGELISPITKQFKAAQYKHGHNPGGESTRFVKGQAAWNKGLPNPTAVRVHTGKKLSQDEIARRTETRREHTNGRYTIGGWKHTPQILENMRQGAKKRNPVGERNPFYGHRHSEETKKIISIKNSGPNNPHWNGGTGTLPYGPEFTKPLKRTIRKRDNYTCQRCHITEEEYGRTLEIHHLDHDKNNNDPSNLVVACHRCNVWHSYHRDKPFLQS
jgi:hypothetical protein